MLYVIRFTTDILVAAAYANERNRDRERPGSLRGDRARATRYFLAWLARVVAVLDGHDGSAGAALSLLRARFLGLRRLGQVAAEVLGVGLSVAGGPVHGSHG